MMTVVLPPSYILAQVPNDSLFSKQWYLQNIGVNLATGVDTNWTPEADIQAIDAWEITKGSSDVLVVVIDTGMKLDHPDLSPNLLTRGNEDWDFYCNGPIEEGLLPCPYCTQGVPEDADRSPDDDDGTQMGHGTSVAGIIIGEQGNTIGISGVAPDCSIMALRIDLAGGRNRNRVDAINFATSKLQAFDAVVINISWGAADVGCHLCCCPFDGCTDPEPISDIATAITNAVNAGCVVVCAGGNRFQGSPGLVFPATMTQTIAVGASDGCDERWRWNSNCPNFFADLSQDFSPIDSRLDVVAPGGNRIRTTHYQAGYTGSFGGTSAAAPMVSGICALVLSVADTLSPSEVRTILRESAEDLVGAPGEDELGRDDYMGYGRVNAYRAVQLASKFPLIDVTRRDLPDTSSGLLDGQGVAWADYNNDGYLDLYVSNQPGKNALFRNYGAEMLRNVTTAPLDDNGYGTGVAWGDYDNDGDPDLYLVKNSAPNRLFRNDGGSSFVDATTSPLGDSGAGTAAAWVDYNNDGYLDLYVSNSGSSNRLFRNDGPAGCGFTDVTSGPLGDTGPGAGSAWADYDNDGDADVYVVNSGATNKLLRNDGGGSFTDVTSGSLGGTTWGQGADWGDYDNDGDLDLLLLSRGGNKLFRNDGGGSFSDVTSGPIASDLNVRGGAWADYDNDGDLDMYLSHDGTNGNVLLRNDGNGSFADVTAGPLGDTGKGRGFAWVDYDRDGDMDIYLANDGANKLFRNHATKTNHWFQVDLRPVESNGSAIGTRVRLVTGTTSQIREASGGSGYRSQNSPLPAFGLGTATIVDTVEVRWPTGQVQTLTEEAADRVLVFDECPSQVPQVDSLSMSAWAGATTSSMTLHFTFELEAQRSGVWFEVRYREIGTSPWTTLTCSSPSASCLFNCGGSYEATAEETCGPLGVRKFEWQARAYYGCQTAPAWLPSTPKSLTAYCLQGP